MKELWVPYTAFLPTQPGIYKDTVTYFKKLLRSGVDIGPLLAVPLDNGVYDRGLIMVDTHNRARTRCDMGQLVLPVRILDKDKEIQSRSAGRLFCVDSVEETRRKYRDKWQREVRDEGVETIIDLRTYVVDSL